jgi:putrescine aminotransferase
MEREQLPQKVLHTLAPYLAERYAELADHPLVGQAETCGFVGGLVLVRNQKTLERFDSSVSVGMICRAHCFGNGLIMRAVGDRMIISPPLIMERSDIDEMVRLIKLALDLTWADLKAMGQIS